VLSRRRSATRQERVLMQGAENFGGIARITTRDGWGWQGSNLRLKQILSSSATSRQLSPDRAQRKITNE
jgi:hypothetical protein